MKITLAISHSPFAIGRRGQATLSFVFLIGTIIISIGLTVALLAYTFLNSGYGFQAANRAMAVSLAGVEDALIKLSRNKDFSSTSPYLVSVGNDQASVTVAQNSPVSGQAKIVSDSTALFQERKLQVIVSIDGATGQTNVNSWQLLTL